MKTLGPLAAFVVILCVILVRIKDAGESCGDEHALRQRAATNSADKNLRRTIYRVSNDKIGANTKKDRVSRHKGSAHEWGRSSKRQTRQKLHVVVDESHEESFWHRTLQQSVTEKNTPTLEIKPTNTNKAPSSAPLINPPPNTPTKPSNSGRFEFVGRNESTSGNPFNLYTLLSKDRNDRRWDWVYFRNEDHALQSRFKHSCVRRFQTNDDSPSNSARDLAHLTKSILPHTYENPKLTNEIMKEDFGFHGQNKFKGALHLIAANKSDNVDSTKMAESEIGRPLDFFIAGFPKCGTTTLLYAFSNHVETSISDKEQCDIIQPNLDDSAAYSKLNTALSELEPASNFGIKCPTGLRTWQGIERLKQHSPHARLVIGVRHPVVFFQSFYNYRVTEIYDKGSNEPIPPAETLVGSNRWRGVSTDVARFELFLMQLGKTELTPSQQKELDQRRDMRVQQTPFKIFLYAVEQLEDSNVDRAADFRSSMQDFLHLKEPLSPFGRENINHFVGNASHPETIDICDERFNDIRKLLVTQGIRTRQWLQDQFLLSADVLVGGVKEEFVKLLDSWGADPCNPYSEVATVREIDLSH